MKKAVLVDVSDVVNKTRIKETVFRKSDCSAKETYNFKEPTHGLGVC